MFLQFLAQLIEEMRLEQSVNGFDLKDSSGGDEGNNKKKPELTYSDNEEYGSCNRKCVSVKYGPQPLISTRAGLDIASTCHNIFNKLVYSLAYFSVNGVCVVATTRYLICLQVTLRQAIIIFSSACL